ncbi:MAG: capsular biosynthesis protein [Pseudomonadota bacterium]
MTGPASVLILQGPLGPFYGRIAGHLAEAGAQIVRVNLSGNDIADWPRTAPGDVIDYDGSLDDWPVFLDQVLAPRAPDVVLMHGDRRPYHKAAVQWAEAQGADVLVTELGYLRPDWMVAEWGGTSALSRFPVDPDEIRRIAATSPEIDFTPRWPGSTWPIVLGELRFTLFNALGRRRFPFYASHRSMPPSRVYTGWLAGRARSMLRGAPRPLPDAPRFVFALQLEGDFQLRDHSPFAGVAATVDHVVQSFADKAPGGSVLVLKPHPHEFARSQLLASIEIARTRHGLGDRMVVVEDQSITALCAGALGFVTVNSSAGIEALATGCPVHCIMPTIYDVPGLTHQGGLDAFWSDAAAPDADLFHGYRRAVAVALQVRGTIYDREGCRTAAHAVAERIMTRCASKAGALGPSRHRLAKAAAMGVTYD